MNTIKLKDFVELYLDGVRRDLSVNAIAKDMETGEFVDPFGGIQDIKDRVFRMVHKDAFKEDPVRILRLARFLAQYPAFSVDPDTMEAARKGSIEFATAERVNLELMKALAGAKPSRFFDFLKEIDQLDGWFKEVFDMIGQTQSITAHLEGDAYVHTMMVLDACATMETDVNFRFACLVHDFGKGLTKKEDLPKHYGHEAAGVWPVDEFCDRLKITNVLRRIGLNAARFHGNVHNIYNLKDGTIIRMYNDMKSHVDDAYVVSAVGYYDDEGRIPFAPRDVNYREDNRKKCQHFVNLMFVLATVKLSNGFSDEEIKGMSIEKRKQALHKMQVEAIKER